MIQEIGIVSPEFSIVSPNYEFSIVSPNYQDYLHSSMR
jgi:hypothetical protein